MKQLQLKARTFSKSLLVLLILGYGKHLTIRLVKSVCNVHVQCIVWRYLKV